MGPGQIWLGNYPEEGTDSLVGNEGLRWPGLQNLGIQLPADRERIAGSRAPLMGPPRPLGIAFNSLIREVNGVGCLPTCWNEFAITHSSWIIDQADAADCAADLSTWLAEMVDQ